jgi:hypothetical protein
MEGIRSMVSLSQAQTVQALKAEGWRIVEPKSVRAKGGSVMMKRQLDGDVSHILIMPNGERSAQRPTAAQIREW